jgi:hypothetical protein
MKAFHGRLSGRLALLGLSAAAGLLLFFVLDSGSDCPTRPGPRNL